MKQTLTPSKLVRENDELRRRLSEEEETLQAIRQGEVDAVVISGPQGDQVYALMDVFYPYRLLVEEMDEGAVTLSDDTTVLYANERTAKLLGIPLKSVIGSCFKDYVREPDLARFMTLLGQAGEKDSKGDFTLISPSGAMPIVHASMHALPLEGRTATIAILNDITERVKAQAALREASERLRQVLNSAPIILWAVNREGLLSVLEGKGLEAIGMTAEGWIGRPFAEAVSRRTGLREHMVRALGGEEIAVDVEWRQSVFEVRLTPVRQSTGEVVGVIGVATDISERRRGEQRLQELTRRLVLVQEEERRRVSRELHDEAGQALTVVKISLEMVEGELPKEMKELHERVSEAILLTGDTMERIRLLAQDLRPPALDAVGLDRSLEGLCRDFARRLDIPVEYRGVDLGLVPETVNVSLYRLLQEALTNCAKHARPSRIWVTLERENAALILTVEDNGKGFDPAILKSPRDAAGNIRLGLLGLGARMRLVGGTLEIESRVEQGTRLVATAPLPAHNDAEMS